MMISNEKQEKILTYKNLAYIMNNVYEPVPLVKSAEILSLNFFSNIKKIGLPLTIINVGQFAIQLQTSHTVKKFVGIGNGDRMN